MASGTVFFVEVYAAYKTGSLALLSDAGHLLVDLSGLGLAYVALRIASRPATPQATYGFYRAEVLAAAFNGFLLLGVAGFIVYQAARRLQDPLESLDHTTVLAVALLGLVANLVAAWILRKDAQVNINTRGAWLNVLGDAVASVGVIASALLVRFTGSTSWDTWVSFLVAAIIVWGGWTLIRSTTSILLETAPPHLDLDELKRRVEALDGVVNVHDLHVWTLTPGRHSLSMHASISEIRVADWAAITRDIEALLEERYGLDHCTIQLDPEGMDEVSDRYDPVHHVLDP